MSKLYLEGQEMYRRQHGGVNSGRHSQGGDTSQEHIPQARKSWRKDGHRSQNVPRRNSQHQI